MQKIKIGDVCDVLNGFAFKSENYVSSGIRVIRIANVQKGYIEDTTPAFYPLDSGGLDKYMLENGDLLMSLTGNVGRVAMLEADMLPAALNQRVACLRLKSSKISKKYLFHILNSDYFEQQCIQSSKGVAQKNMSTEWLKDYEIPLYSPEHQDKIVSVLDRVHLIINTQKKQLQKLDDLVKARFVELFGDPVNNPMGWSMKKLTELGELNRGVSKARPRNSPELLGGPYPLIQTGDVSNAGTYITSFNSTYSEKGFAQSRLWPKGTLCITIAANIAQTSILTFDACFPDSVVGFISADKTNELFVHYWFSFFQKILDEQAPQVAQKNINLKILSELEVIMPPPFLQNQFAAFVHQVDKSKVAVQKSLDEAQHLFDCLMQEYFS